MLIKQLNLDFRLEQHFSCGDNWHFDKDCKQKSIKIPTINLNKNVIVQHLIFLFIEKVNVY